VPSLTEFLCDLDLEGNIVGVTKFCVHPTHLRKRKVIVGGTKTLHIDKVKSLRPDLVIANKEENTKEMIEAIEQVCPVFVSDISTLEDSYQTFVKIGKILDRDSQVAEIITRLNQSLSTPLFSGQRVGYLIWKGPYMTIGGDTYISSMLTTLGLTNAYGHIDRYPQVSIVDLQSSSLDYLFLSSEPYPFKQEHRDELARHLPKTQILLVDGEVFSWYGTRLLKIGDYFDRLHSALT